MMNEQQQQQQQPRRSKWDIPADAPSVAPITHQQPCTVSSSSHQDTNNDKLKHVQDAVRRIHEKIQPTATPSVSLQQQQHSPSSSAPSQSFIPIVPETTTTSPSPSSSSSSSTASLPYTIGPDNTFIKEIEINNARNRYTLTKGATLTEIERESGATVTVKGRYYREGEERDPNDERPLFLHIAAENEDQLNKAVAKIDQLMKQSSNFLTAKVYVDIENPDPGFNIPANLIGKGGINVKHITQASGGTRVQLKGRGSGYREPNEADESDEPLHLHLSSSNAQNLEKGKNLAESLVRKVRQNHDKYVEQKRQYQLERQQQREQQREQKQQQQQQQQHPHATYGAAPYSNSNMAQYYQYYGYQPNMYTPYPTSDVATTPPPPPGVAPSVISSATPPPPPPGTAPIVSPPGVNAISQQYSSHYQQYYDYYYGSSQTSATPVAGSTPPPPPPGTTSTPPPPPPGIAPSVQPGPPGIPSIENTNFRKRRFEDTAENGADRDETSSAKKVKQHHPEQPEQLQNTTGEQQSSITTDTSQQLYGGLTEQEYYNQYYQNYYAQYYQQQVQSGQGVWQQAQMSAPDQQYQQQQPHQQADGK